MANQGSNFAGLRGLDLNTMAFVLWKKAVEAAFRAADAASLLKKDPGEDKDLGRKDAEAFCYLVRCVTAEDHKLAESSETCHQLFEALVRKYDTQAEDETMVLLKQLISQPKESDSVADIVNDIENMSKKMDKTGVQFDDKSLIQLAMLKLPEHMEAHTASIKAQKSILEALTFQDYKKAVISYDKTMNVSNDFKASSSSSTSATCAANVYRKEKRNQLKKKTKCEYCNKLGHRKEECRKLKQDLKEGNAVLQATLMCPAKHIPTENDWMVDTGATFHCTPHKNLLTNFTSSGKTFATGNGNFVSPGFGSIKVKLSDTSGKCILSLSNVYYLPMVPLNIFSPNRIQSPYQSEFNQSRMKINMEHGQIVALKKDNVYIFSATPEKAMNIHEKLGHPGKSVQANMEKHQNIPKSVYPKNCIPCVEGKFAKPSHNKKIASNFEHLKPGNYWHADFAAYQNKPSIGGNRYYIIFKCHVTGYRKVFLLKNRENVQSYVKILKNTVKVETGNDLAFLHTDAGTEFTSNNFKNFLIKESIQHFQAETNTPQQNGKIERDIRSVTEKARTLLSNAKLSVDYWDEAICHAVFLMNRLSKTASTPYEQYYGKKYDYSKLITFGQVGAASNEKATKFEAKTVPVRYLGNEKGHETLKRCLLDNGQVKITSAVKFFKEDFEDDDIAFMQHDRDDDQTSTDTSQQDLDINEEDITEDKNKKLPSLERLKTLRSFKLFPLMEDPRSYKAAVESEECSEWELAMENEHNSLVEHNVYEIVPKPRNEKIIASKWVFRTKIDQTGNVKYKARLVVLGNGQDTTNETFSPVASYQTIRSMLALHASTNATIMQFDVATAFLHGSIKEDIYIQPPKGIKIAPNNVWHLKKSLYGLKSSPRTWFEHFKSIMLELNFKQALYDSCVFYNGSIYVILYVDDGLVFGEDKLVKDFLGKLAKKVNLKTSAVKLFLGMDVMKSELTGEIRLSSETYIGKLDKTWRFSEMSPRSLPCPSKLNDLDTGDIDENLPYREIVGALNYLASTTRPDIAFMASYLSRYLAKPTQKLFEAAMNTGAYLHHTKSRFLTYSSSDDDSIVGYTDASWKNISQLGVLVLFNGLVDWKSKKSSRTHLSTNAAEMDALSEGVRMVESLGNMLDEITGVNRNKIIYTDSNGVLTVVQAGSPSNKLKHLSQKNLYAIEAFTKQDFKLIWVPTGDQLANGLTKPFTKTELKNFRF